MLVVNLYGAPGAGKSVGAAYIFAKLKMAGINAELITEFGKDMVWENNRTAFENQVYIFGEQYYRLTRLKDKVDVAVTDSPILLGAFYNRDDKVDQELDRLATVASEQYDSFDVFIHRATPYEESGRLHSKEESDNLSDVMQDYLDAHGISCLHCVGTIDGYDMIVDSVLKLLGKA